MHNSASYLDNNRNVDNQGLQHAHAHLRHGAGGDVGAYVHVSLKVAPCLMKVPARSKRVQRIRLTEGRPQRDLGRAHCCCCCEAPRSQVGVALGAAMIANSRTTASCCSLCPAGLQRACPHTAGQLQHKPCRTPGSMNATKKQMYWEAFARRMPPSTCRGCSQNGLCSRVSRLRES